MKQKRNAQAFPLREQREERLFETPATVFKLHPRQSRTA